MSDWKNNRPGNWEEIAGKTVKEIQKFDGQGAKLDRTYVEAGADAILEALKSKGSFMSPEQMRLLAPDRKYPYGWLVFIEESK